MAVQVADARARLPRPLALGIVAVLLAATGLAIAWPQLPWGARALVVGPTRVDVITRQIEPGGAPRAGETAPDFEWVSPDGRTVRLSSLRGHPVVLNFWATWCVPCKTEMPLLDGAAASDPATRFFAVDLDEDGERIRAFFDQIGVKTIEPMLDVGLATSRRYGLASVPSTFFIDAHGTIRHVQIGEMDQAKLQAALDRVR